MVYPRAKKSQEDAKHPAVEPFQDQDERKIRMRENCSGPDSIFWVYWPVTFIQLNVSGWVPEAPPATSME